MCSIKVRLTGLILNQRFLQREKSLEVVLMQNLIPLCLFEESVDKSQAWRRFGGACFMVGLESQAVVVLSVHPKCLQGSLRRWSCTQQLDCLIFVFSSFEIKSRRCSQFGLTLCPEFKPLSSSSICHSLRVALWCWIWGRSRGSEIQVHLFEHPFHCEGDWTLAQFAQRWGRGSICEDLKPSRSGQMALLEIGVGPEMCSSSATLWFCASDHKDCRHFPGSLE